MYFHQSSFSEAIWKYISSEPPYIDAFRCQYVNVIAGRPNRLESSTQLFRLNYTYGFHGCLGSVGCDFTACTSSWLRLC